MHFNGFGPEQVADHRDMKSLKIEMLTVDYAGQQQAFRGGEDLDGRFVVDI